MCLVRKGKGRKEKGKKAYTAKNVNEAPAISTLAKRFTIAKTMFDSAQLEKPGHTPGVPSGINPYVPFGKCP